MGVLGLDFRRFSLRWRPALKLSARVLQAVREQPSCHYLAQGASELLVRPLVCYLQLPSRLPAWGSSLPRLRTLPLRLGGAAWCRGVQALGVGRVCGSRGWGHWGKGPERYPGTGLRGPEKPMGTGAPKDVWREPWRNRRPLHTDASHRTRPRHTAPKWDTVRLCAQGTKHLHRGRRGLQTDGDRDLRGRESEECPQSHSVFPFLQCPLGYFLSPSGSSFPHLTGAVKAGVPGSIQVLSP